jgi:hypothetical protein
MKADKLNMEYELLLQKANLSSNIERTDDKIVRPVDHIYFVICNSCYWCASYFGSEVLDSSSQILGCHVCNSHDTELIPVSTNESFRIDYNVTRGMEMEFYRSNDIVDRQPSTNIQHQVPSTNIT